MIELERTFLAKRIPDLANCKRIEIIDIYIPKSKDHPTLRIRKSGEKYEITKKEPISGDSSKQKEETIKLNEDEFLVLSTTEGKMIEKVRFHFEYKGRTAEIDVFRGELEGLILVDFEFESEREKNEFEKPDFCLVDVTKENFIAGGMLCGKTYSDIENDLKRFRYEKIHLK